MVEKLDRLVSHLVSKIKLDENYIALTADHTTTCLTGNHTGDPIPLLITGPKVRSDSIKQFSERSCASGSLGHLRGTDLMPLLMNYLDRTEMVGA